MKKSVVVEILIWIAILIITIGVGVYTYIETFVKPNIYIIQFKDIDGITKGSPVRFMGINIGYVRKLKSKNKHIDVQIIVTKKEWKFQTELLQELNFMD